MKRTLGVILAAALLLGIGAEAQGSARNNHYSVTLICPSLAEDSAAHVRLVTYVPSSDGHPVIVYRCKRFGY